MSDELREFAPHAPAPGMGLYNRVAAIVRRRANLKVLPPLYPVERSGGASISYVPKPRFPVALTALVDSAGDYSFVEVYLDATSRTWTVLDGGRHGIATELNRATDLTGQIEEIFLSDAGNWWFVHERQSGGCPPIPGSTMTLTFGYANNATMPRLKTRPITLSRVTFSSALSADTFLPWNTYGIQWTASSKNYFGVGVNPGWDQITDYVSPPVVYGIHDYAMNGGGIDANRIQGHRFTLYCDFGPVLRFSHKMWCIVGAGGISDPFNAAEPGPTYDSGPLAGNPQAGGNPVSVLITTRTVTVVSISPLLITIPTAPETVYSRQWASGLGYNALPPWNLLYNQAAYNDDLSPPGFHLPSTLTPPYDENSFLITA